MTYEEAWKILEDKLNILDFNDTKEYIIGMKDERALNTLNRLERLDKISDEDTIHLATLLKEMK